jgi:opacity protein-like surface antigen
MKFLATTGTLIVVTMVSCVATSAATNEELLRRLETLEKRNARLESENATLRDRVRRQVGKQIVSTEPLGRSHVPVPLAVAPIYKTAPMRTSPFNWTGFYVGAHAGYGWLKFLVPQGPTDLESPAPTGGFWGGQVGGNYQFASHWVIGAEFDAAFARIEDSRRGPNPTDPTELLAVTVKLNSLTTLRGRLGFEWDRTLFYAAGGGAWSEIEIAAASGGGGGQPGPVRLTSKKLNLQGWTVGGGIERALWANWTGKIEYLYFHFDPFNPGEKPGSAIPIIHAIKVGVNYLFL